MASGILGFFHQVVPVGGYQVKLGQALISIFSIGTIAGYAIKKIWRPPSPENHFIYIGNKRFSSLDDASQYLTLACTKTSHYVVTHLLNSEFRGKVLDLGGGIGANALPLVAKGCSVILMDQNKEAIEEYEQEEDDLFWKAIPEEWEMHQAELMRGDITVKSYPENIDAVICIDTLPFIQSSQVEKTVQKIFKALRPNGKFIGSVLINPDQKHNDFTRSVEMLGAHFCRNESSVQEMLTRSGFYISESRKTKMGGKNSGTQYFEFVAIKLEENLF